MDKCLFCQIRDQKLPAKILYESDDLLAFNDIHPVADVHIVIITKKHIANISDAKDDGKLLSDIYKAADDFVKKNNLDSKAYRIVVNGAGAQHVPHLHFHLIGGQSLRWEKN